MLAVPETSVTHREGEQKCVSLSVFIYFYSAILQSVFLLMSD